MNFVTVCEGGNAGGPARVALRSERELT